jgi:hypothetical protein
MDTVEAKGSLFAFGGSTFSAIMGWIPVSTLVDAIIIAVISTLVGFYTSKIITIIDTKIKDWVIKRNKDKKA